MNDRHASRQAWLQTLPATIAERDRALLERASRTLVENVAIPEAGQKFLWEPYRGICPSPTTYKGVWNWDSAFHMLAVARWDPRLAYEQAYIFCDHQNPDGSFVDVVFADGRVVTEFSKPPVFPWACARVHGLTGDDEFVRRVYPHLCSMEDFWWTKRGGEIDGLFHYGGTKPELESGWDNSVRWDAYLADLTALWPVDLNCFMVMLYRAMQYLAPVAGEAGDAEEYRQKEAALIARIDELWDVEHRWYVDAERSGRPSAILSPASFMPLYIGIAPRDRADRMAELAADPGKFSPGIPTVSYDDPEYKPDGYWRGPTWLNTHFFATMGLKRYGHTELADTLRETMLGWCAGTPEALHEYYDTRTGAGIGAANFGWTSAFVIEYILSWDEAAY